MENITSAPRRLSSLATGMLLPTWPSRARAEKIKIVADEGLDSIYPEECRPTTVDVKIKDGKIYTKRVDYPKGEPRRPLTDEELYEKFVKWAGPSLSPEKAESIREALFRFEEFDDVSEFMGLL